MFVRPATVGRGRLEEGALPILGLAFLCPKVCFCFCFSSLGLEAREAPHLWWVASWFGTQAGEQKATTSFYLGFCDISLGGPNCFLARTRALLFVLFVAFFLLSCQFLNKFFWFFLLSRTSLFLSCLRLPSRWRVFFCKTVSFSFSDRPGLRTAGVVPLLLLFCVPLVCLFSGSSML